MNDAQFIGVGVGPGDPELVTIKAARLIRSADVISYIANEEGNSQARDIVHQILEDGRYVSEIPVLMPMNEDRTGANQAYDAAAKKILGAIDDGKNVVFLCEGDPLFFGSFAYLLARFKGKVNCQVVPGISSVHAAASVLQEPLTMLRESFAVISGRHSDSVLVDTLKRHDSVVIMKAGKSRQRIMAALSATGRTDDTCYLEYIGRDKERVVHDIEQLQGKAGPYFSLFVVTRKNRTAM